jgi:sodium/potassium/calcium exchanger 2
MLIPYIAGVLYMFVALAIVCDEFFVPALEEIANEDHMNLSMDVAGATLMAAGGSAPELFTSLIGTFGESDVGFGTIVGSAVFNVLFVIGMCAMFSREILTLTWWPLFRDCTYYLIGLITLFVFFAISSPNEIHMWEALVLFAMYFGYVLLMAYNQSLYKFLVKMSGKELPKEEEDSNISFVRPSTFRAGLLKLLMKDGSFVETAGVGIVSKLSGNVEDVFQQVDTSGNGLIDSHELAKLFEMLECPVTDSELAQSMKDLDENGDGQIDYAEFTKWCVQSDKAVLS